MTRLATSAVVFVVGFFIFLMAAASAWALYSLAVWAYGLIGPWLWVLVALGLAEVGRREMRRYQR